MRKFYIFTITLLLISLFYCKKETTDENKGVVRFLKGEKNLISGKGKSLVKIGDSVGRDTKIKNDKNRSENGYIKSSRLNKSDLKEENNFTKDTSDDLSYSGNRKSKSNDFYDKPEVDVPKPR